MLKGVVRVLETKPVTCSICKKTIAPGWTHRALIRYHAVVQRYCSTECETAAEEADQIRSVSTGQGRDEIAQLLFGQLLGQIHAFAAQFCRDVGEQTLFVQPDFGQHLNTL